MTIQLQALIMVLLVVALGLGLRWFGLVPS